jgi:hypothetical protein
MEGEGVTAAGVGLAAATQWVGLAPPGAGMRADDSAMGLEASRIPRNLFADILRLIAELCPPPVTSTA